MRSRTIGSEVATADFDERFFRIMFLPSINPLVCSHESDLAPFAGAEAETPGESGGSQQYAPGGKHLLPCPFADLCDNFVSEVLPCQAAAVECLPDGFQQGIGLLSFQTSGRIPVWLAEQRARSQRCHPQRKLIRGKEMQSPARTIRFDQRASLP